MKTKVYALDKDYLVVKELPDIESSIIEFELKSMIGEDYFSIIRVVYNEDKFEVDYGMDYEVHIINKETEEDEDGSYGDGWFYERLVN